MTTEQPISNSELASLLYDRAVYLHSLQDQISMFAGRSVTLAELASSGLTADLQTPISNRLKDVAETLDRAGVTGRSTLEEARWKSAKAVNNMLGRTHVIPLGCQPHLHAWGQDDELA